MPVRDTYLNEIRALLNPEWCGFLRHGRAHLHDARVSWVGQAQVHPFSGYTVRLHWTGFRFQANIVEEYVLLSALLLILVGLKRTWDRKLSSGLMSSQLILATTGLILLIFMTIYLFQCRSADTEQYFLRLPPTLIY